MLKNIINKYFSFKDKIKTQNSSLSVTERQELAQKLIAEECDAVKNLLIAKNKSYGNSALEPINILSKDNAIKQIYTRIDDKLSRLRNQSNFENEDTILDLIGYLILSRVSEKYDKIIGNQ